METVYVAIVNEEAYCFTHIDSLQVFKEGVEKLGYKVTSTSVNVLWEQARSGVQECQRHEGMKEAYKDLDGALDGYYERMPNPFPEPEEFI
jgi:hypothetical protein